jgi:hypothetical protein
VYGLEDHTIVFQQKTKINYIQALEDQIFNLMGNTHNTNNQHRGKQQSAHSDRDGPVFSNKVRRNRNENLLMSFSDELNARSIFIKYFVCT